MLTQIKPPLVSGLWSLDSADSKTGLWFLRVKKQHKRLPWHASQLLGPSDKYKHG